MPCRLQWAIFVDQVRVELIRTVISYLSARSFNKFIDGVGRREAHRARIDVQAPFVLVLIEVVRIHRHGFSGGKEVKTMLE